MARKATKLSHDHVIFLHFWFLATPSVVGQILARSISLAPEEEPDKYLNMAQLHEGREALDFYEKGLEVMHKQLDGGNHVTKGSNASLKQRLCMAYCSVGELYLTDLCFEEDAERRCQARPSLRS